MIKTNLNSISNSKIVLLLLFLLSIGSFAAAQNTPAPAPVSPGEGETVHVLVGKSIVINVQAPLTRVLSSNPSAVEALATSPTQVVVEGKAAGNSSLILWDASGRSQILDVAVDLDIAGLRSAIQRSYPKEQLEVESDAGRLMLTGTASNAHVVEDLGKMASSYSAQVVNSVRIPFEHERQVVLEVKFAEVDRTALLQLGANWFTPGAGHTTGLISTGQFGGSSISTTGATVTTAGSTTTTAVSATPPTLNISNPLNLFLFNSDINLGVTIQALQAKNVAEILAEPNLMAISGQKATFLAGGEFPFPIVQPSSGGLPTVTISFKPFGVKLDFVATIEDDNTLRLHVAPEVSTLDFSNALTLSGFTVPAISTRRAETEIELKDGQSFGIAGLLDRRATTLLNKVPGIGDIPILGQLFRSKSINKTNTELMVFVTPHIVDPVRVDTPVPAAPKLAVPFLDVPKFDKDAPGNKEINANAPPTPGVK
ncbi:MAG TPA: type II and III secretion system protein family protein [Candidatus Acidoferrum sp.]|nr:type II and III secretion system protein family protein [Candidatus Acidoferrum sp.]